MGSHSYLYTLLPESVYGSCLYTTGRALHKPKLIIIEQGGKGGGARGKCFFFDKDTKIPKFQI